MASSTGGRLTAGNTIKDMHLGLASLYALLLVLILFAVGLATPSDAAGQVDPSFGATAGVERLTR